MVMIGLPSFGPRISVYGRGVLISTLSLFNSKDIEENGEIWYS
ncbi:conserved hypothetical protein [Treponema phagedenis]|uniref:Uncharacterized protein n=1 Tax=Treponema phagedenis TaxID=162 RepID=A0A0B7GSW8_TREPH|nr:conserved hypothetical protein [Treponema phagedenis]